MPDAAPAPPSAPSSDANRVLVLVRDLIFATKISGTASAVAAAITLVRDPAKLTALPGRLLIVDLNLEGAIPAATRWRDATNGDVIGFVSHTDTATIAEARDAGIARVLARSQFVQVLPDLLRA
jgi:hypothetical protein